MIILVRKETKSGVIVILVKLFDLSTIYVRSFYLIFCVKVFLVKILKFIYLNQILQ